MSYKYLKSSLPANSSPSETWKGAFQEFLTLQFENSTTFYTIQEESYFGSGIYENVDVRVNHAIDAKTGVKLGDDYKLILFPDLSHTTKVGYMYYFDNNYWITVNSEAIKNLASSCTVKRCNNNLRWVDTNGSYYVQPCSIDYAIKQNRDYNTAKSAIVTPSGNLEVTTQFNSRTNRISPNRRFLFGNTNNWNAYKVQGGGINNLNNLETDNNNSTGILLLSMAVDYVNESNDDLTLGIADVLNNVYTIEITEGSVAGVVGQNIQLHSTTKLNDLSISTPVTWFSSNLNVATISTTGLLHLVSAGTCNIICYIENNLAINDTIVATSSVSPIDDYKIQISPEINYILLDTTQSYAVYLYKNGTQQANTFTFSIIPPYIPVDNYVFNTVDANHFSIKNNEYYLSNPISISCVSGAYNRTFEVYLRGKW